MKTKISLSWIAQQSNVGEGQDERPTGENHRFSAVPMDWNLKEQLDNLK